MVPKHRDMYLDIGIKLPSKSFYKKISYFPHISTHMPNLKHQIKQMDGHVHIGNVSFTTRNASIVAEVIRAPTNANFRANPHSSQSLNADNVAMSNVQGEITAKINATSSVTLNTHDGNINAFINITNTNFGEKSAVALSAVRGCVGKNYLSFFSEYQPPFLQKNQEHSIPARTL
jgi:hypothetical protein